MNSEVKKLHRQLGRLHQELARKLGKTVNADEAEAILREMEEVSFRVMMAGRLLFKQTTSAIDGQLAGVVKACSDLDHSISKLKKVETVVKKVGKLLQLADRVLDKVKLI